MSSEGGALLVLFGLVGGAGLTGLGPGGVLVTIGLYTATGLTPPMIAGTGMVVAFGAGVFGSAAYLRSGHLNDPATGRLAWLLALSAIFGAPIGVLTNAYVSAHAFGTLLGVCLIAVAVLLTIRRRRGTLPAAPIRPSVILVSGALVAGISGLFGLGGQLLSVPLLIVIGIPTLSALSSAQVQSIVITGVGTVGYASRGDLSWPLAALTSIPVLLGAFAGWHLAQTLPADRLGLALVAALFLIGTYLLIVS